MKNLLLLALHVEKRGGVQTRIANYVRELRKRGINTVILSIGKYPETKYARYHGSNAYSFPVGKFYLFPAFLARIVKKHGIDALHVLEGSNGALQLYSLIYARLKGIRCGVSCYGGEVRYINEMKFIQRRELKPFEMLKLYSAFAVADRIAVNSRSTLTSFIPHALRKKCRIVYPGANSELLNAKPANAKKRRHNILVVGRMLHRKGVDDLIRALHLLHKKFPDTTLTVCGKSSDNYVPELQELSLELGLGKHVEFVGIVSMQELARHYAECEVFCLPSKTLDGHGIEGFGCVYLEAALFKKPVVGTRHFGIQEAVAENETGLLVEENNPKQIAGAIAKLFGNKKLAKGLGESGFRRTMAGFMDVHSTGQLVDLYAQRKL